jgi:hypothetical protein
VAAAGSECLSGQPETVPLLFAISPLYFGFVAELPMKTMTNNDYSPSE